MPLNEQQLASEIASSITQEFGGGGKDVDKYRRKLAKAISRALIAHIRLNLDDTNGDKHF